MKTIEERADEYVDAPCEKICLECNTWPESCRYYTDRLAFIAGAESEHKELTQWNSPDCPPDSTHEVLAQICGGYYKVVVFDSNNKLYKVSGTQEWTEILGWREIHE